MRFIEFHRLLREGYKEAEQEFSAISSKEEAKDIIQKYKSLVNRNQVKDQERNIDYWRKLGWNKFKDFVDKKSEQPTMTQIKRKKQVGRSITLDENDKWLIVVPLDKDASCFHGKDTDWCTTKPFATHFEQYFYDSNLTLIYFIRKSDLEKWAIAYGLKTTSSGQKRADADYFNKKDQRIDEYSFEEQTGLNPNDYIKKSHGDETLKIISKSRDDRRQFEVDIANDINMMPPRTNNHDIEDKLFKIKNPNLTRRYIEKVGYTDKYTKPFMKMAVNVRGSFVLRFLNADDSIKKDAIKNVPNLIFNLDNVTRDMIKLAVFQDPDIIVSLPAPDKELQLIAVRKKGRSIVNIDDPDREVQLEAVKTSPSVYTGDKITFKDDPEIMLAALTNSSIYADRNLKYMLDNNFEVTEDMINAVMRSNLYANLTHIIPVIIFNKEKFKFDAVDLAAKIYRERREED
jgi:hypothetical protein